MSTQIQSIESERKLIEACKRGDHRAFEQIYVKYKEKIYSLCTYMCGDRETAKDLTQQIFLKAYTSLHSFRFGAQFSTWLLRLAMNVCIDHQRKTNRTKLVPIEKIPEANKKMIVSDQETHLNGEMTIAIEKAMTKLSDKLRQVVVLKYIWDLSYTEISKALGCSVGTVGSRLNRSHQFLAQELKHLRNDLHD